jgi:hypothetical protein
MNIDFLRTGGIAGVRLSLALDTHDLPEEDAGRIRRLVEASGFFDLDPHEARTAPAPDRFEYRLAIRSEVWGTRELLLSESSIPDEVRPLLEHLTELAMSRRGAGGDS